MKNFLRVLLVVDVVTLILAVVSIEKIEFNILDKTKGSCTVKINPGPPKSVDVDIESFVEAKDITLKFAAFSLIDGNYNEFMETDSISICDAGKSDNPLIAFVYKEVEKAGNVHTACPVKKMKYHIKALSISDKDVPIALPAGHFKIELNGTLHEHDKDVPLFVSDLYFSES